MNNDELAFMVAACEISDAHENGSGFIDNVAPILATLSRKGMSEKQVWQCQFSLKRAGYIRLYANYNVADVDPEWSQAAPEFSLTPIGLRWWLIRKYGQADYSKMVHDVKTTRDECMRSGISVVADWAERLKLPVVLVQKILYAEKL
jgi:hypothetical protein